ncbi:hypothetical protein MPSEU_000504500 [Mayamaea pseudoterrestris]|nr:hypothetical protein MPSEU_000504500 [Mayamaea pseudoterrestris]
MGGNRKNRQSSNAGPDVSSAKLSRQPTSLVNGSKDLLEAVEEVHKFSFRISMTELVILLVLLISCILCTFLFAVAAEISISIHYFDKPAPPVFKEIDLREQEMNNHRFRITLPEQDIVAYSTAHHDVHKFRLQRVIHVEPSGHPKAMLVVEESTLAHQPVNRKSNAKRKDNGGCKSITGSNVKPPMTPAMPLSVSPKLCSDGTTVGFDTWDNLNAAVLEANKLSVEHFVHWSRFFADTDFSGTFQDDRLYYEEELIFKVCPGTELQAKHGPIFINAPNLIIECEGCVVNGGSSHLSFGPNAKNVMIRGFTFTRAWSSSLIFFHNGAEVAFADCFWYGNTAINSRFGAVADINSTSNVNFYRCNIGQGHRGENDLASSLSIRV